MKKTLISTTLLTLLATTALSAGMAGAASTVDTKPSDAAVLFSEKSSPLVITAVPDMHFGTQEIDRTKSNDYQMTDTGSHIGKGTLNSTNIVSIQDDRSKAKLDGWDLQVAQTDFTNMGGTGGAADPTDILTGTQVVFKTASSTIAQTNSAGVADFGGAEIALNSAPTTFMRGDATAYGSVAATLGTGIGADAINLRVPSTVNPAIDVHYQSELTWTLVASPTAP